MSIQKIEKNIYSTFASIAKTIGYSDIHGRIIAALMVSGKRLSLQELSDKTGCSLSTLSLSMGPLESFGMVKKIKDAGDRKLYLELQGNLLEGLKKAFVFNLQRNITDSLGRFDDYKKSLNSSSGKDRASVMNALNILEKEIRKLDKYINLLAKIKL